LTLSEILKAISRHPTPEKEAQLEKVLDVLRVTPLVNLIRESPDEPASYIFLDGQRRKQPVEVSGVR